MNNRRVFLDTSYIIALLNPDDNYHEKAKGLFEALFSCDEIWITDAILFELGNGLSKYRRDTVVDFIKSCYQTKQFHVVDTNQPLLMRALDRFGTFKDKKWSLTDCLSFEVMATYDISVAYSSDHRFEQAGFQYLLQ